MQHMMLPIIIAATVMLAAFGLTQMIASLTDGEKRKLKQRLLGDNETSKRLSEVQRSIKLHGEITGFSIQLNKIPFLENLNKTLTHAYPETSLARFCSFAGGIGFFVFMLVFALTSSVIVSLVSLGIALYLPIVWLTFKRAKRQKLLADQLPEALDFLSRILKAGHSLSTGLQMMSEELPRPLASEFHRAYDQHCLGQSLEDCFRDMARRIESTDFAFFVTAVLIQRQTGGDLSEVLNNISGMIRQRIRLQQHVKAKTAEGRFTGYILTAFPAVMFVISYIMDPERAGVLLKGSGLMLLGLAVFLQMLGLFFVKKLTTVKV